MIDCNFWNKAFFNAEGAGSGASDPSGESPIPGIIGNTGAAIATDIKIEVHTHSGSIPDVRVSGAFSISGKISEALSDGNLSVGDVVDISATSLGEVVPGLRGQLIGGLGTVVGNGLDGAIDPNSTSPFGNSITLSAKTLIVESAGLLTVIYTSPFITPVGGVIAGEAVKLAVQYSLDNSEIIASYIVDGANYLSPPIRQAITDGYVSDSLVISYQDWLDLSFDDQMEVLFEVFGADCFLPDVMVDVWLAGSTTADDYMQSSGSDSAPRSSRKPIEKIVVGDNVLAFDTKADHGRGALLPKRVTETYVNTVSTIIDFHGTGVTPGHVTLCGDGPYAGRCVPIIDILKSDGAIVKADGTLVRASTNCEVDSVDDAFLWMAYAKTDKALAADDWEVGKVRRGTKIIKDDGATTTIADMLTESGLTLLGNGLVRYSDGSELPARWFGELPTPEQYVLALSGLRLADLSDASRIEEHSNLRRRAYGETTH